MDKKEKDARSRGRDRRRPACLLAMLDQGFSLSSGAQGAQGGGG